ncbi:MAG: hypothetical protein H6574_00460 [Lewinellaceae bacterium]|nr:hypothetical protein [Saprospiraceae bacterium]MCB9329528.1 hypothetical protein [Lewinellaceae bacterium]
MKKTVTPSVVLMTPLKGFLAFCCKPNASFATLAILTFLATNSLFSQQKIENTSPAMQERVKETLKKNGQSLRFMENKGQLSDDAILYYFEGLNGSVYIKADQIRFVANDIEVVRNEPTTDPRAVDAKPGKEQKLKAIHSFTLKLNGANLNPDIRLGESFSTKYNFFTSEDPNDWASGVRAAKDLTLHDVYPNIDLRLYSTSDGQLEFDWILYPGADFRQVQLNFDGQDKLAIDPVGNLEVGLRFTKVKFHIPESYQVTESGKIPVNMAFKKSNEHTIGFATESKIDTRYPLVIDPILSWGTYFDGNDSNFDQYLFAIQTDPVTRNLYCAGATNRQISTASAPYDANGYLNVISGFGSSGTPRVAIVYTISSDGSDLLDMTLYGPSTVSSGNEVVAFALSLSANRVFIGGWTEINIPLAGTPFDASRESSDGFVAVFSKDLGTLHYATYLGSSSAEDLGVTSIRALNDNSFVVGFTAEGALPAGPGAPDYITTGADLSYGGGNDMFIAKFSNYNTLDWGTYVGGSDIEAFNDLEVFPDGRVAFVGYGEGTLTEVNSAADRSTGGSDYDGIIGVLNNTGTAFLYLDEIGGDGEDYFYDVLILGEKLYFTGRAGNNDFPTPTGVYDTDYNGGSGDALVGMVDAAGSTGYKATFYGTGGTDIGNGIQQVSTTDCDGNTSSFLLVFGTVNSSGLPTQNINNEPYYDSSYNGGTDMFFGGFSGDLTTLIYGTYIGGSGNDYLGDTGNSRGANHLWIEGADLYLGTTTHSSNILPTTVTGSFDNTKSNGGDDSHILLCLTFSSIVETDYGDAPASYGTPSHTLNCQNLGIGLLLDAEASALPNAAADGDDTDGVDDEDGLALVPALTNGGPQNITVSIDNIKNTTGDTATLYGWIDFDSDGKFQRDEATSVTVASGFTGTKMLVWSAISVTGSTTGHYMRFRLTTNNLVDALGTTDVDERSVGAASDGEVEDYLATGASCTDPICPDNQVLCISALPLDLAGLGATPSGGTFSGTGVLGNSYSAPAGTNTVTYTYNDGNGCETSCMFEVTVNPLPVMNCPGPQSVCVSDLPLNLANLGATPVGGTFSGTGVSGTTYAAAAGTTNTVSYTVTDNNGCKNTCTFNVTVNPLPVMNCPGPQSVCVSDLPLNLAGLGASPIGGVFSGTGVSGTTYAAAAGTTNTVSYTVTDNNGCKNTCTFNVTVYALPVMACPPNLTVCIDDTPFVLSDGSPANGTHSGTGVSGGNTFTPATAGPGVKMITYTASDIHNCSNSCTYTIRVVDVNVYDVVGGGEYCKDGSGKPVGLSDSDVGFSYQLKHNGIPIGAPVNGTGMGINFGNQTLTGTYTVEATLIAAPHCSKTMNGSVAISITDIIMSDVITHSPEFCMKDPGPVIGLSGSKVGVTYQLQTGGGSNLGAPVPGDGNPIYFGVYPNGSYKVVATNGMGCTATTTANVNAQAGMCEIDVPDYCTCNAQNGFTPVTIKVSAPAGQTWEVKEVIGLYGPNPYLPVTVGTPLNYIGGNMYTLDANRSNTKGYFVKMTNGFTDLEIQVGNPSW